MPIQFVKKTPIGQTADSKLTGTLLGTHTLDEKQCMAIQIFHRLRLEGFPNAGPIDFCIPLLDMHAHPLTHFADGKVISETDMRLASPYDCAADAYDRRPVPPLRFTPF